MYYFTTFFKQYICFYNNFQFSDSINHSWKFWSSAKSVWQSLGKDALMGPVFYFRNTWPFCLYIGFELNTLHMFCFFPIGLEICCEGRVFLDAPFQNHLAHSTGFEPVRAEPNRFLVCRLNHSAKSALASKIATFDNV